MERIYKKAYFEAERKYAIGWNNCKERMEKFLANDDLESAKSESAKLKELLNRKITFNMREETTLAWDFIEESQKEMFAEDDVLLLKPLNKEYYQSYINTRKEYSIFPSEKFSEPDFIKGFIYELGSGTPFFTAVVYKETNEYIGYIAINNTRTDIWEFSIELLPQFCHKGYGTRSVGLFLNRISEITGHKVFRALVEVENFASQALMNRLGGELFGIYNKVFHDEVMMEEFERENLNEITEHMRNLADKLAVEPCKLLSHVLDYRIDIDKMI